VSFRTHRALNVYDRGFVSSSACVVGCMKLRKVCALLTLAVILNLRGKFFSIWVYSTDVIDADSWMTFALRRLGVWAMRLVILNVYCMYTPDCAIGCDIARRNRR